MTQHRVDLHGGWSLWRWFAIRAPGFPFELLDRLAAPDAAAAVDDPARGDAARVLARETERITGALRAFASDPRVRETMLWQRRRAIDRASAEPDDRELARAVQRLCAKNDSVGFFGPVGWGSLVADADASAVTPGASLLARRSVYFAHWGIDELAAKLSENGKLLLDVAPRRMPMVRLDGNSVQLALGTPKELPEEYARVLAACDGVRTAREVATAVADAIDDPTDVYDMLSDLRDRKLVYWSFQIPTYTEWPERVLRSLLVRTEPEAQDRALATLAPLEAARDAVAAAAGDPAALEGALGGVERAFVEAIGEDATRRAGEPGTGRTLVYEECVRDFDLRLPPAVPARVGPALSLVLQSARWYTHAIAERCRAAFAEIHEALRAETGSEAIEYIRFLERAATHAGHPNGISHALVDEVAAEVQRRWAKLLALDGSGQPVRLASDALRAGVDEAFAAPHPGWPLARLVSVDLFVAARSPAEVTAGDALFVLGELVPSTSLLIFPFWLRAHPDADALIRACTEDTRARRVAPIGPKPPNVTQDFGPVPPCDYDIEFGATPSQLPRDRVVAVADLVVTGSPAGLVVETRDRRVRFDLIACFEEALLSATMPRFQIVTPAAHVPRITIDQLVISRERWRLAPDQLAFARAAPGLEQFAGARRWAQATGIPRRVFVRTPEDRKLTFVDFASPLYVELLCDLVRGASQVTITEMLPTPDELWLADADGKHYTTQLRMTAVDPIACPD